MSAIALGEGNPAKHYRRSRPRLAPQPTMAFLDGTTENFLDWIEVGLVGVEAPTPKQFYSEKWRRKANLFRRKSPSARSLENAHDLHRGAFSPIKLSVRVDIYRHFVKVTQCSPKL